MVRLHSQTIPRFRTETYESGYRDVFLLYWDGGDEPPIREQWLHFDRVADALAQVAAFLKVKAPTPSQIAERYFEKHHAHIYRDAAGNMAAVSIVKIPVEFYREDDDQ